MTSQQFECIFRLKNLGLRKRRLTRRVSSSLNSSVNSSVKHMNQLDAKKPLRRLSPKSCSLIIELNCKLYQFFCLLTLLNEAVYKVCPLIPECQISGPLSALLFLVFQ